MEYYIALQKDESMPLAATQIDLEIIILSEVSHRQISWYHLHVESKKMIQMNLRIKQKQGAPCTLKPVLRTREATSMRSLLSTTRGKPTQQQRLQQAKQINKIILKNLTVVL